MIPVVFGFLVAELFPPNAIGLASAGFAKVLASMRPAWDAMSAADKTLAAKIARDILESRGMPSDGVTSHLQRCKTAIERA